MLRICRSFLLAGMVGWISVVTVLGQDKEKEAIKAVILRETNSFLHVDRKTWSESWEHVPRAYWSFADSTGSSFLDGWEKIDASFDDYFRNQKPSGAVITDEWNQIEIYGTGAYVRFIQRSEDGIDVEETSQVRVLEKVAGKWKVVCMSAVARYPKPKAH